MSIRAFHLKSGPSGRSSLLAGAVQVERRVLVLGGGFCGVIALWAAATTFYILAKDELASRFVSYQSETRYTYEDRIASLQAGIEREVTRSLVERTTFQRRADALAARQAEIEARQGWIQQMTERNGAFEGRTGALPGLAAPAHPLPPAAPREKPEPLADGLSFPLRRSAYTPDPAAAERIPAAPSRAGQVDASTEAVGGAFSPLERLALIERSIDAVTVDELRTVEALRQRAQTRTARLRAVIEATGIDTERLVPPASLQPAIGGPLVELPKAAQVGPFAAIAAEADARSSEFLELRRVTKALPLSPPLPGDPEQTSGFGYRLDPFTRGVALHTGVDLRVESGSPVRAAGSGRVTEAGWSGGYGNMVEIDHGAGVVTRYGHLGAIGVPIGARVEAGQVIALSGSTGRSTGPHLHYETRINGEPVNPNRFIQAARLLAANASR